MFEECKCIMVLVEDEGMLALAKLQEKLLEGHSRNIILTKPHRVDIIGGAVCRNTRES